MSITKYSDRLLMFLLEACDPQMFGDGVKVKNPGATDAGFDKDREKGTMETLDRLNRMERPDEANE